MTPNSRILQQFNKEAETWKRLLEFMRAENIHLKTRISEVASDDIDDELLAEAENFLNHFLQIDEMITLAFHDIQEFEKLVHNSFSQQLDLRNVFRSQHKLRSSMEQLEHKFNKLKFQFNFYLSEKL